MGIFPSRECLKHLLWFNVSLIPIYLSVTYVNAVLILVCLNECSIKEGRAAGCLFFGASPETHSPVQPRCSVHTGQAWCCPLLGPVSLRAAGLGHREVYCFGYTAVIGTTAGWEYRGLLSKAGVRNILIFFLLLSSPRLIVPWKVSSALPLLC